MAGISNFNTLRKKNILCEVFLCHFCTQLSNVKGAAELSLTQL